MRECGPVPLLPFMGICLFPRRASLFAAGEGRKRGFNKRESLGRERGRFGGGKGKPFSRRVPLPLPNIH